MCSLQGIEHEAHDSGEKLPLCRKRQAKHSFIPEAISSSANMCDKRGRRQMDAKKSAASGEIESRISENGKKSPPANSATKSASTVEKEVEEADMLELSLNETLYVREENLELRRKHCGNPPFVVAFDDFMFVQFIRCLRDLCLYMALPNMEQFQGFEDFLCKAQEYGLEKSDYRKNSRKLEIILQYCCGRAEQNAQEKFLLRQFLKINLPLLYSYTDLNKLLK